MSDERQLSPYRVDSAMPSPYYLQYPETSGPAVVDLRSYWLIFYKRRYLILLVALLVGVLAALANRSAPKVYIATAQVRIDPNGPEYMPLANAAAPAVDNTYYETEYAELRSAELARRVIEALRLYDDPRLLPAAPVDGIVPTARALVVRMGVLPLGPQALDTTAKEDRAQALVETYLRGLTIAPVESSRLVDISFASPSAELSAEVANAHAREFIRMTVEARTDFYAGAQQFLEARLAEIKKRTEESEIALNDFRRRNRVLAVGGSEKENVTLERLASFNSDYVKAQSERISAEAEYNLVKKRRYESLATVQRDPLYNSLRQELEGLRSEYSRLSQVYQAKYPKMQELAGRIQELEKRLGAQIQRAVEGVESEYLAAKAKEEALGAEVDKQKKETLDLNDLNAEYQVLARDAEANRDLYKNLLSRAKETNITQSMQTTNVRVVSQADVPSTPSFKESRRKLSMALAIGLCLGLGIAFSLEYIDNSVKTPEDAEALLQLPALAVVPSFAHEEERRKGRGSSHRSRAREVVPRVVALDPPPDGASHVPVLAGKDGSVPGDPSELVVASRPDSIIAEAYRTLRTGVLLSNADKPPQVIQLVSALSREGKTVTSVNTALTLAQSGAKVLLIDADLRRPRCSGIFQTPRSPGLVDLLVGFSTFEKCIRTVKLDGVENIFHGVPMTGLNGNGSNGNANGHGTNGVHVDGGGLSFGSVSLLPAGTKAPNPAEILGSQRMRDLLRSLREQYDYIIIDSPPVLPVADSVVLSTMVDGVIMVIKGQSTSVPIVKQALAKLERVGARMIGSVLNDVDVTSGDYYYYKGYYAAYNYLEEERA